MTDFIRRLVSWAVALLREHSAGPHPTPQPLRRGPLTPPWPDPTPLPTHRSPYVPADTPLDTTATNPVRPYLITHEQRQRRRELALAALGQEMPGPYWIHGLEVA